MQCEKLRNEAAALPGLRAELEALKQRHFQALELMGERDEEVCLPCSTLRLTTHL
jgi:hypothetical protein